MIISTTHTIQNKEVSEYLEIVTGETILGANFFKDFIAGFRDILGGRSTEYESSLKEAREIALKEMEKRAKILGADAILGVDINYETVGGNNTSMLMVTCSGTAVKLK